VPEAAYLDWCFSWFSSVFPRKCYNTDLKLDTTTSFHGVPISDSAYHSTMRNQSSWHTSLNKPRSTHQLLTVKPQFQFHPVFMLRSNVAVGHVYLIAHWFFPFLDIIDSNTDFIEICWVFRRYNTRTDGRTRPHSNAFISCTFCKEHVNVKSELVPNRNSLSFHKLPEESYSSRGFSSFPQSTHAIT